MEKSVGKVRTVREIITWGTNALETRKFESARLTVELLLAHVLRCTRSELFTNAERPLAPAELDQFEGFLKRRLAYEPLQYILGSAEFMGLSFAVDRRVLIPRPETEVLVEAAVDVARRAPDRCAILDVGTGSGNIAVALAKFLPRVTVTSIDASSDALDVARVNVGRHNVSDRIALLRKDVFQPIEELPGVPFAMIVSNPPYITNDAAKELPPDVIRYEPPIAVYEAGDGLRFFRRLAELGPRLLEDQGWIFVEVAWNQAGDVQAIFSKTGYDDIAAFPDYSGHLRVVKARVK